MSFLYNLFSYQDVDELLKIKWICSPVFISIYCYAISESQEAYIRASSSVKL